MKATTKKQRIAVMLTAGLLVAGAGVASATFGGDRTTGSGAGRAVVNCPGGMSRLGHPLDEDTSVFPFDPAIHISNLYTVADDFFRVEDIEIGAHTGTHLDVPSHFIEGGRSVDELVANEFVWPAYKIDVRGETFVDGFVTVDFIRDYEREHGFIRPGSLVILQTGAEEFFGLDGPGDAYATEPGVDKDGQPVDIAANTDDLFDFDNPGFSGDAVQWLFDHRRIDGVGSDAYGPDAASDADFSATFTTLANDGVALVAIANLDAVNVRSDVIIASTVNLTDGSGFPTDPLACHGLPRGGGGWWWRN